MSDFIESMFGGGGDEKMPTWAKIIIILAIIVFVLPLIVIAVPIIALVILAFVKGDSDSPSSKVPTPVKNGAAVVKDTFSSGW